MVYVLGFYIPLTDVLVLFSLFTTVLLVAVLLELKKLKRIEEKMMNIESKMESVEKKLESDERSMGKMLNKLDKKK
jgi:energy-converting hydrogenase Eha subunit H